MSSRHVTPSGWHLFGSEQGYTTLAASGDVTVEEASTLEEFGFGDTQDRTYLESLWPRPAILGRPLPSGRFALTRCFPGPSDTAGRSTLRFATLIFHESDWTRLLRGDLLGAVNRADAWRSLLQGRGPREPSLIVDAWPTVDPGAVLMHLDAALHCIESRFVSVSPDNFMESYAVVGAAALLPELERKRLRWGLRVLNAGAPVDLCTLADRGQSRSRRAVLTPSRSKPSIPYVSAVEQFWQEEEPPWRFVDGVRSASEVSSLTPAAQSAGVGTDEPLRPASRFRRPRLLLVSVTGVLVVSATVTALAWIADSDQATMPPARALAPSVDHTESPERAPRATPAPHTDARDAWRQDARLFLEAVESKLHGALPSNDYHNLLELLKRADTLFHDAPDPARETGTELLATLRNERNKQDQIRNETVRRAQDELWRKMRHEFRKAGWLPTASQDQELIGSDRIFHRSWRENLDDITSQLWLGDEQPTNLEWAAWALRFAHDNSAWRCVRKANRWLRHVASEFDNSLEHLRKAAQLKEDPDGGV